jgi:hypothetical protein
VTHRRSRRQPPLGFAAISRVVRPPTARRVSATWEAGARSEWQQQKSRKRVSSPSSVAAARGSPYVASSRYGGPDAAPVITDGPHPETSDLVAGWWMIDVDSQERAVELAAYVSSEPGPRGEPLYEWIDVREIMSAARSETEPA